jgi:hypothetical protein
MISPTSRMIPIETKITKEQWLGLPEIIAIRQRELSKLRYGDAEMALWLMEQLEHIIKLRDYNEPRFAKVLTKA